MSELGMYFGIAVGCIALLAVSGGIIYRKHRQDAKVKLAVEQEVQDRLQQVVVCIYEHELPPDVLPPVQPIFVHSASDDTMHIPPEDDPLVAQSSAAREIQSPSITSTTNHHPAMLFSPPITIDHPETGRPGTPLSAAQAQESYFEPININMPTPPPQAALFSPVMQGPTTPSSVFSSSSIPTVPRSINQEMINLARVRAPPSYDVPNVVVDRSPLYHPSTHSSPYTSFTEDGHLQDDYFGHVRNRAHTFSHPSSSLPNQAFLQQLQQHHRQQLQQQQQQQQEQHYRQPLEEEELPATPRYSLEFPSDVPHELHLEQHQRSRAQYDNSVLIQSPSSFTTIRSWDYEQGIQSHDRPSPSFSTQSQPGSHTSSPLLMFEQTTTFPSPGSTGGSSRRGSRPGLRARASTLGESSKALMQRMHSLLRHSTSAQSRDSTPASSPRLAAASILGGDGGVGSFEGEGSAGVPMVGLGLGLEYSGHVAPEPVVPTQAQEQEHGQVVVVVDEPEEETGDNAAATATIPITASASTAAAARPSGPISLRSSPSIESLALTLSIDNDMHEHASEGADNADSDTNDREVEVSEDDESVSKSHLQHAQPAPPAEPMATMPMPLAVS
ncbi:hypothetical protein BGZ95_001287 [Linnemannia exigua]|uniref:Uncharacterized protein n=1 Tax=Linnemannia exigua TaxID=604196 RepID=A0AAD4DJ72_9FUNG|nr:hypothetical protein BGZ95_001287 [Linnemannia exigua]